MGNEEMRELFKDFDALAAKERVDAFVELAERWSILAQEGPIRLSRIGYLTIEHGIAEAAEAVGEELHEYKAEPGRYLYCFYYKGYEFNCYSKERLGKYAGEKEE